MSLGMTALIMVILVSLVGVVVIGVIAITRSTTRSDVRRSSVDDPGLDRRLDER